MTYLEKLEEWYQTERAKGDLVDLKFFPVEEPGTPERIEAMAKAVYETVTGQVDSEPLDISALDHGQPWR